MEDDDGNPAQRGCIMLPEELVQFVCEVSLRAMHEWHEDNDYEIEPLVLVATMRVAGNMIEEMVLGSSDGRTLQ